MSIPTTKFKSINLETEMMDAETIKNNFISTQGFGENNTINTRYTMCIGANNTAGVKAWYWTGIDKANNYIYLTDDQSKRGNGSTEHNTSFISGYQQDDIVTIINNSNYDVGYKVLEVSGNRIKLNSIPFDRIQILAPGNEQNPIKYTVKNLTRDAGCVYVGDLSLTLGVDNTLGGNASFAQGYNNTASGAYSMAQGRECVAQGYDSHAEGRDTLASGEESHAEGKSTKATNFQSHAEGFNNECHGMDSHVEGRNNIISQNAHVSHAEGQNVKLNSSLSFAWNGTDDEYTIPSTRKGSFNINPINGTSGIYIGDRTLSQHFNDIESDMHDVINTKNYSNGDEIDISDTIHNDGFISKHSGSITELESGYSYTDKLELDRMSIYEMSGTYIYDVTACTLYDDSDKVIQKLGYTLIPKEEPNYSSKHHIQIRVVDKTVSVYDKDYPENCNEYTFENASYIRFSSETNGFIINKYNAKFGTPKYSDTNHTHTEYATTESVSSIESSVTSLNSDVESVKSNVTSLQTNVESIRNDTNETKVWFQTLPIYEDINCEWIKDKALSRTSPLNGEPAYIANAYGTELLPIESYSRFNVDIWYGYNMCPAILFNENKKVIHVYDGAYHGDVLRYTKTITYSDIMSINKNAKYIAFSSYVDGSHPQKLCQMRVMNNSILFASRNDVLFNKKLVVCGDSFSSNNDNGITPYPEIITNRTGMHLTNISHGGDRMSHANEPNGNRVFSESYTSTDITNSLTNADYILFQYGLNEGVTTDKVGDKDSNTPSTLWGAWNKVLFDVITWNPTAKIGIIISDAWMNTENYVNTYNALKQIAEWWGIPVLDLKEGVNSNPMIGSRTGVNPKVSELRNNAFRISESDSHPNQKGHDFRSTIIENFLRSL